MVGIGIAAVIVAGGVALTLVLSSSNDEQPLASSAESSDSTAASSAAHDPIVDETGSDSGAAAEEREVTRVARQAVTALNDDDAKLAESIACDPENVGDDFGSELPAGTRVSLVGTPSIAGDQARVPTEFAGHGSPNKTDMPVRRTDGDWCVVMEPTG